MPAIFSKTKTCPVCGGQVSRGRCADCQASVGPTLDMGWGCLYLLGGVLVAFVVLFVLVYLEVLLDP